MKSNDARKLHDRTGQSMMRTMGLSFSGSYKLMRMAGLAPESAFIAQQKYFCPFAFIHINKCGGTSVERALRLPIKLHDTALERRDALGRRWEKVFKFSVVRHPYDRVTSLYRYRAKTNQNGMADMHISLNDWITAVWGERDKRYFDNPRMFAPCHDWLSDENGNLIVDFVAKLEEIDRAWAEICSRIGIQATLPRANITIQATGHQQQDTDARSKGILDEAFSLYFKNFDYTKGAA